jgi:hypothetical protein
MPAASRTRPKYVVKSYCERGSSLLPGRDEDMAPATKTGRPRDYTDEMKVSHEEEWVGKKGGRKQ